ncbi:hypothetical protein EC604_12050 [Paenibacillus amylolyticus]|uniref:Bacterial toxin 44 domain-containing protein n=2 Tax=Paenibacillus TaxID=44249 RepID=A0A5M9WSY5_PAEAM|nr:hypothetical protein [Paenibacillus amylolyticus]KAA8784578.1 hypothetical protein EC604_12050 [Paenibacillus amylolyticus]
MEGKIFKLLLTVSFTFSTLFASSAVSDAMPSSNASTVNSMNQHLEESILLIQEDLEKQGTSIEAGLTDLALLFEQQKQGSSDLKEIEKLEQLVSTIGDLSTDYKNYKNGDLSTNKKNNITLQAQGSIYAPAVAAIASWFGSQGYLLSAELLLHAKDNTIYMSNYSPAYGSRVRSSSVTQRILASSARSGSGEFPNSGGQIDRDLYYAIHYFNWTKTPSFLISDVYDFAPGQYSGLAGTAVNAMYFAQQEGYLTPYKVLCR